MPTVQEEITKIQKRLHDGAAIWSAAELLRLWRDGYRELLARSGAFRQWRPLDVPPRHAYAVTHDWEAAFVTGTVRRMMRSAGAGYYAASGLWEAEHLGIGDLTPAAALAGVTYDWERSHVAHDRHFRFTMLRDHDRVVRLQWANHRLDPVSVRELDELETAWESQEGEPLFWAEGVGRTRSLEVYQIQTEYGQAYDLRDGEAGIPRYLSGSRTWAATLEPDLIYNDFAYTNDGDAQAMVLSGVRWIEGVGARITWQSATDLTMFCTQLWEVDHLDGAATLRTGAIVGCHVWEEQDGAQLMILALGLLRGAWSPDRQYLPVHSDQATEPEYVGRALDWRSSEDSVFALEVIVPREDVDLESQPALLPTQLFKYVRFYVLWRCFGRSGEGRYPALAAFWRDRFERGVLLVRRLADLTDVDRQWQRAEVSPAPAAGRPPRVRLPSSFPRVF